MITFVVLFLPTNKTDCPQTQTLVRRLRTEEDEALARRLQAQWISEDTAAGVGIGGALGGPGPQVPFFFQNDHFDMAVCNEIFRFLCVRTIN